MVYLSLIPNEWSVTNPSMLIFRQCLLFTTQLQIQPNVFANTKKWGNKITTTETSRSINCMQNLLGVWLTLETKNYAQPQASSLQFFVTLGTENIIGCSCWTTIWSRSRRSGTPSTLQVHINSKIQVSTTHFQQPHCLFTGGSRDRYELTQISIHFAIFSIIHTPDLSTSQRSPMRACALIGTTLTTLQYLFSGCLLPAVCAKS